MPYEEITAATSKNRMKHINTLCVKNVDIS
jgi:hypothetical protein